ncbi:MAG: AMP-binding protein [Lachnospiraceae bacterium]|nr:AMP-binding protein [Lachnospiraceae bacterium]
MINNSVSNMTGKASADRPWLNFYPEPFKNVEVPKMTVEAFLKMRNPDENRVAIEYYGCRYTWKQLWEQVDMAARALKVLGFGEEDRIPVFVQAVPAHYILLLAAERIGASILCRDDVPEELGFAIRKTTASTIFVHDYLSKEDEELFRNTTEITKVVKVSPFDYADKDRMPDYVLGEIASRYQTETETVEGDMTWEEFLNLGKDFQGEYRAPLSPDRPVFGAYTSGSTGVSKLVIHSSANIVAVAYQMSIFAPPAEVQEKWWLPILTPALIAATVSMTIFPLSAGQCVILDPFCPLGDIDIQFMKYKPNYWALIPMFCEILMKSERIPEDYDMSHLRSIGTGAEPMNDRKSREVEEFFHKHNCMATLSAGYGQSEGCSNFTLPNPMFPLEDGCVGMPMPATLIAVFDPETLEEKSYGELGEVCMNGPAKMLYYGGYSAAPLTERTLVMHPDGEVWLHTGDNGYITEHGIVHITGRGYPERFGGGILFMMRMESRMVEADGVRDGFFCFVPDAEHEGYFEPHLFVILDEGRTLEEVKPNILATLEKHEYPVEYYVIGERPYFHFKTNRKELTEEILAKRKK